VRILTVARKRAAPPDSTGDKNFTVPLNPAAAALLVHPALGVDELDARRLERAPDGLIIGPGELGLALGELGAPDGGDADGGGVGELLGAPADNRPHTEILIVPAQAVRRHLRGGLASTGQT